jgi:TolB protein
VFTLSVSRKGEPLQPVGSVSIVLADPVYTGLVVCSHDDTVQETALITRLDFQTKGTAKVEERGLESTLETLLVYTGERQIAYQALEHFEAPNWSRDGKHFIFNSQGRLYRLAVGGNRPELIDSGPAIHCNNDHGLSPDGKWLAISHSPANQSIIYVLPSAGGTPRRITPLGPSYWHGWSPDGQTLAYCAQRNGEFDIYTIPAAGGDEKRLTTAPGLDDGPDYSPDGQYIYFNSERTGNMRIWRMRNDGNQQEQVTFDDEYGDWFPHPSPDGKWLVFVSYNKNVKGHPPNHDVVLRLMPLEGGKPKIIARLFGGQGTINVPS